MPDVTLSPAERRIEFELFDRYVNGTATPADQAHVEQWAAFDPAHVDLLTIARTGRRAVALDAAIDVESALARTHAAIDASARAHRTMPSTVPTGWWRHAMGTAAAGVIAVLAWSPVTR